MRISSAKMAVVGDRCRVSWNVELQQPSSIFSHTGARSAELWIDWPESYYLPSKMNADAALLILFPLAMRLGEPLEVEGPVSAQLLWNVLEAMAIYRSYFPGYAVEVPLKAKAVNLQPHDGRMASFFSGGVDSLFNLAETLRLNSEYGTKTVSDLWVVRGMDVSLKNDELWHKVKRQLWKLDYLPENLRIVDIWTNARDLHGKDVGWEEMGFSPILGGLAKCFADVVSEVLIGSLAKYENSIPHASSPLVDPMWSCDRQQIRHFTARMNRAEKIESICRHLPDSLNLLRVCWKNSGNSYNCGKCEKCLRTQMQLKLCGMIDNCNTFNGDFSATSLERNLKIPWRKKNYYVVDFWSQLASDCSQQNLPRYSNIINRKIRLAKIKRRLSVFSKRK